jgi:hypothetical protein
MYFKNSNAFSSTAIELNPKRIALIYAENVDGPKNITLYFL